MEVFWRPKIANARDRNLSQVADNAALPLLCQAKNLSLAQLFRMLESGARVGARLRQLTRLAAVRNAATVSQLAARVKSSSVDNRYYFALKPGSGSKEHYAKIYR